MYDVKPVTSAKPTDCGATCLLMLLQYYNKDASLDELNRECNTRLIGCSGKDILRTGRAHGLDMVAYKMTADELIRQDRPGIIFWKYSHWCVFAGRDADGRIWICNPDRGRFRLSEGIFKSFYSGIAFFNGEPHDTTREG